MKDGTPYFMWNIEKIRPLIAKDHQPLSTVEYWVNEVRGTLNEAEALCDKGNDKIGFFIYDSAYDNVPKNIREEVRKIIENKE